MNGSPTVVFRHFQNGPPNTNFPAGFQPAEGKKSPVSLQQRDRAFIRQKNLAVPLFLPRNAATRQRSDNRLPLYRSGSVRPTGFPVQTGRSEASIQLHPPLPRTARQLSGGGKETAFSSSTRFLYARRIIARLSGRVKRGSTKVLLRRTAHSMTRIQPSGAWMRPIWMPVRVS